jgi:hypothetical protein
MERWNEWMPDGNEITKMECNQQVEEIVGA